MSDNGTRNVEDRLRDATKSLAGTVGPSTARRFEMPAPSRTARGRGWLVPVAAVGVAAVCAVAVVGTGALGRHTPGDTGAVGSGGSTRSVDTEATQQPSSAAPRYYAAAAHGRVFVHDAKSGAVTGSAGSRTGEPLIAISSSADGRTFFATTYSEKKCRPELYKLVVGKDGKIASFGTTKLDLPGASTVSSVSASRDGRTVAVGLQSCSTNPKDNTAPPPERLSILVGDPMTGHSKRFTYGPAKNGEALLDATLSADGRRLLYGAWPMDTGSMWRYRTMDTSAPAGRIHGTPATFTTKGTGLTGEVSGVSFSPDGRSAVGVVSESATTGDDGQPVRTAKPHDYGVVRWDVATGRPQKVLYRWSTRYVDAVDLLAQNAAGDRFLLIRGSDKGNSTIGRLDGGRFTRLPGVAHNPGDNSVVW